MPKPVLFPIGQIAFPIPYPKGIFDLNEAEQEACGLIVGLSYLREHGQTLWDKAVKFYGPVSDELKYELHQWITCLMSMVSEVMPHMEDNSQKSQEILAQANMAIPEGNQGLVSLDPTDAEAYPMAWQIWDVIPPNAERLGSPL